MVRGMSGAGRAQYPPERGVSALPDAPEWGDVQRMPAWCEDPMDMELRPFRLRVASLNALSLVDKGKGGNQGLRLPGKALICVRQL
eukprot:6422934-Alexandrium_andersonii.AAC.1